MAAKEKKYRTFLFMQESCSNEADQSCLYCQTAKKLLEMKLQTSEGKSLVFILLHMSRIPPQQENIEAISYHCPYLLQKYSEMDEMIKMFSLGFKCYL